MYAQSRTFSTDGAEIRQNMSRFLCLRGKAVPPPSSRQFRAVVVLTSARIGKTGQSRRHAFLSLHPLTLFPLHPNSTVPHPLPWSYSHDMQTHGSIIFTYIQTWTPCDAGGVGSPHPSFFFPLKLREKGFVTCGQRDVWHVHVCCDDEMRNMRSPGDAAACPRFMVETWDLRSDICAGLFVVQHVFFLCEIMMLVL